MPKPTEKQSNNTAHRERDRLIRPEESRERHVEREERPAIVEGTELTAAGSSTDDDLRSYRRDHSAEAMGRSRTSETKLPGNEYCDNKDDVPTAPNIFTADPGPGVSQLVTLKDGGGVSAGGGYRYRIPITPHMIVIAMQNLMKKGREQTPQAIADFIREKYPVCKSPRGFTHELVDKLQCAVATKIILRFGNNGYILPARRRNRVHLLRNETKAFWQRYSRILKKKKNKPKLPTDSSTRFPIRFRSRGHRQRSGSSSNSSRNGCHSPSGSSNVKKRKRYSCDRGRARNTFSTLARSPELDDLTETPKSASNSPDRRVESSHSRDDSPSKRNNQSGETESTTHNSNIHQESRSNNKSQDNDSISLRSKGSTTELRSSRSSDNTKPTGKTPSPPPSQSERKGKTVSPVRRASPHSKPNKGTDDTDKLSPSRRTSPTHSSSDDGVKPASSSKDGLNSRPKRSTEEEITELALSHRSLSSHSGSSNSSEDKQMNHLNTLSNNPPDINKPTSSHRDRRHVSRVSKRRKNTLQVFGTEMRCSKCQRRHGNAAKLPQRSPSATKTRASDSRTRLANPHFYKNINDKEIATSKEKENAIKYGNDSENKRNSCSNSIDKYAKRTPCNRHRHTGSKCNKRQEETGRRKSVAKSKIHKRSERRKHRHSNRSTLRSSRSRHLNKTPQRVYERNQSNNTFISSKSPTPKSKDTKDENRESRSRSPIAIVNKTPISKTTSKSSMRAEDSSPDSRRNSATPRPSPEKDRNIPFDRLEGGPSLENKRLVPRKDPECSSGGSRTPPSSPERYSSPRRDRPPSSRKSSKSRDRQRKISRSRSPHHKERNQNSSRENSEHSRRSREMSRDVPDKKNI